MEPISEGLYNYLIADGQTDDTENDPFVWDTEPEPDEIEVDDEGVMVPLSEEELQRYLQEFLSETEEPDEDEFPFPPDLEEELIEDEDDTEPT